MTEYRRNSQPVVSVEYFPARGLSAERALMTGAHALRRFDPAYQTVTFGAGGTATEGSLDWTMRLQGLNGIPTASHLTICHFDRDSLIAFVEELWGNGIERLVVLRGDAAEGHGDGLGDFESVADAVRLIKTLHPFDISVSAYPEVHPKAESLDSDLQVLLEKQNAGADRAITQYFFSNDDFYKFRARAEEFGIKIPLIPGIMPINNFEKIKGFSERCGATVPSRFDALFAAAGGDKAKQTDIARSIVEEQVRNLAQNGVDAIHVYTLNRVDLTADAIRAFQAEFSADGEAEMQTALAS